MHWENATFGLQNCFIYTGQNSGLRKFTFCAKLTIKCSECANFALKNCNGVLSSPSRILRLETGNSDFKKWKFSLKAIHSALSKFFPMLLKVDPIAQFYAFPRISTLLRSSRNSSLIRYILEGMPNVLIYAKIHRVMTNCV